MHVAIHDVRDMELTVEVLGQHTSGIPFDADDLCLSVLFAEFTNFTKHSIINFRSDYGFYVRQSALPLFCGKRPNYRSLEPTNSLTLLFTFPPFSRV